MPELLVHIADEPDRLDELVELVDPSIRVTAGKEHPDAKSCDILVAGVPDRELVEGNPGLRALVIPWSGVPNRTRDLMAGFPGVAVHNLHHNALQVAELAMALLLAAAKRVVPMDASLRRDDWSPRYRESAIVLLAERRALVLGGGAIGRHLVPMLEGLGMHVTTVRRAAAGAARPASELKALLPEADVLMVCLPLTDETRGIVGADELALLPDRAILVNVGRGPLVDESALYQALRDGTLHAAGLDVWYNYPTDEAGRTSTSPSEHPFHELDNVVMSPHRGGAPHTQETESLRMRALARLLNAAARGEPVPNRVDLELGY
jgi:phosphoglycerate dehydrogenase-like enzyme